MRRKKTDLFTRGYSECRNKLIKNSTFTRSCFNCAFYYKTKKDKEEVCQNSDVLKYDMVVEKNNIYCLKWEMVGEKSREQQMFKSGRSKLD